jgi:hypothetical protein
MDEPIGARPEAELGHAALDCRLRAKQVGLLTHFAKAVTQQLKHSDFGEHRHSNDETRQNRSLRHRRRAFSTWQTGTVLATPNY